jgi:hypothetical protein
MPTPGGAKTLVITGPWLSQAAEVPIWFSREN